MTNKKFLLSIFPDFNDWVDPKLLEEFNNVANSLERYLCEQILIDDVIKNIIVQKLPKIISPHPLLDYDENGVVEAYVLWHFLDRYHRFQLTFLLLAEKGLLPVRELPTSILSIGSGPAPELFSVSDMFFLLREYGFKKCLQRLQIVQIETDYVEKSKCFRRWLHHFVEFINFSSKSRPKSVPYHHGSFYDFTGLNLQKTKHQLQLALINQIAEENDISRSGAQAIVDNEKGEWKDSYRYNMIILSYFLTNPEEIYPLEEEIASIARSLRNGGLIIVLGATGNKYLEIYNKICNLFSKIKYMKPVLNEKLMYSAKDAFGIRLSEYFEKMKKILNNQLLEKDIKIVNLKRKFDRKINPSSSAFTKWRVFVFRKQLSKHF